MPKYLEKDTMDHLTMDGVKLVEIRNRLFNQYGIDLLDTDVLTKLELNKVTSYDPTIKFNFARNGEDAISMGVEIEVKCSKIKKQKSGKYPKTVFQFHAMGDIESPRYIFAVLDKNTLSPIKIYDISKRKNTKFVFDHLAGERGVWMEKGRLDESKMKRDVITISEDQLKAIKWETELDISGCKVFIDNKKITNGQQSR